MSFESWVDIEISSKMLKEIWMSAIMSLSKLQLETFLCIIDLQNERNIFLNNMYIVQRYPHKGVYTTKNPSFTEEHASWS